MHDTDGVIFLWIAYAANIIFGSIISLCWCVSPFFTRLQQQWLQEFGCGICRPVWRRQKSFGRSSPQAKWSTKTWPRLQCIIANTTLQLTSCASRKQVPRGWRLWMVASCSVISFSTSETHGLLARRSYENILNLLHTPVNITSACCVYTCVLI